MRNLIVVIGLLLLSHEALATTRLQQIQAVDANQVSLVFDGRLDLRQVETEFFNDVIQLSIKNVSVYPAKISNLAGGIFKKVFAYQYSPRLIRTRFSVKGKAEDYKERFKLAIHHHTLVAQLNSSTTPAEAAAVAQRKDLDLDEQALLDKVLKNPPPDRNALPAKPEKAPKNEIIEPLATGKPLPNPFFALGKLAIVVALFCGLAFLVKKLKGGELGKISPDALKRFAGKIGRKDKMIEMVSTHYLGPKKSIAVVKVAGRMLVLGVSNESINLITQLANPSGELEMNMEDLLMDEMSPEPRSMPRASAAPAGATSKDEFDAVLGSESTKPQAPSRVSVRSQIKSRLEGLKPL